SPALAGLSLRVSPDAWERSGLGANDGGIGGRASLAQHGPVAAFPESYIDCSHEQHCLGTLTQADLARAAGCHPRSVRYWENKGSNPPTNVASTLDCIEQALNRHGVIPFSTPTPGVRCSN